MREFLLPESSAMYGWYIPGGLCDELIAYFEKAEVKDLGPVSYTHLTLPTNREV